jgi:hypothetical protein
MKLLHLGSVMESVENGHPPFLWSRTGMPRCQAQVGAFRRSGFSSPVNGELDSGMALDHKFNSFVKISRDFKTGKFFGGSSTKSASCLRCQQLNQSILLHGQVPVVGIYG